MRALSYLDVRFGAVSIAVPLLALTALSALAALRRRPAVRVTAMARTFVAAPPLSRAARIGWWMLVAWLAVRALTLGIEIGLRPLFPWDAWIQWATKARVWYELGYLAPFARAEAWFAANGGVFFDASPEYPPTIPLLQVWSCIALGRWDDALMNWPWLAIAVALVLAVYGGMRRMGHAPGAAIVAAAFVATLPLLDVHVALAGYADMPLAAYYSVAVLAMLAWTHGRTRSDLTLAIAFALACTQIKQPGVVWAATVLPAIVPVLCDGRRNHHVAEAEERHRVQVEVPRRDAVAAAPQQHGGRRRALGRPRRGEGLRQEGRSQHRNHRGQPRPRLGRGGAGDEGEVHRLQGLPRLLPLRRPLRPPGRIRRQVHLLHPPGRGGKGPRLCLGVPHLVHAPRRPRQP
jgi:hypothetical protein